MNAFFLAPLVLIAAIGFVLIGYCAVILSELREIRTLQSVNASSLSRIEDRVGWLVRKCEQMERELDDFIGVMTSPLDEEAEEESGSAGHRTFGEGGGHD